MSAETMRTHGYTLLEVTLAVLIGIAILAGVASAFNMYRDQSLIQQAKTELQEIRNQLAMAAYRQGYPCSAVHETVPDPGQGNAPVTFSGAQFYAGATTSVTAVTSSTQLTVASTVGFWPGELVEYWTLPTGASRYVAAGTAIFNGPANGGSQTVNLIGTSTIPASAVGTTGFLCAGLKCNLAGKDASNLPISYLNVLPPILPSASSPLPSGAGIADPFLNVANVRWMGPSAVSLQPPVDAALPPYPATATGDFQYASSPDNSQDFGGLAMDGNCNVYWVLPDPTSANLSKSALPNLAGDAPVNW